MSAGAESMLSGPRAAAWSPLRRLVSRAMARELSAFVVPGMEIARAHGLDLRAAGLATVPTPRHANVLVVVGELAGRLPEAAVVAYAQMPRPRAVLAVGSSEESLPTAPDVSVERDQDSLVSGVAELRRRFLEGAFDLRAGAYQAAVLESRTQYVCPMHPEVAQDEPGTCPKCGMDLVAQDAGGGGHDHGEHDHGEGVEGDGETAETIPPPVAGEDFMSMVEMTAGTPRGSDGLQMEWVRVPFGPLFPGLPGGLSLVFTLGGDTVERVEYGLVAGGRGDLSEKAESPGGRMRGLDPLSPVAYRLLARRALEAASGREPDERTSLARVAVLERERAASHLSWLAGFGHLVGYEWLARRAGELQLTVQRASAGELSGLREEARRLYSRVERAPLLRRRLASVGVLDASNAVGPVARAAGPGEDVRSGEESYRALGFEPLVRNEGDALARLRVRLAEIGQSLDLAERAGATGITGDAASDEEISVPAAGRTAVGEAAIETPRGAATLSVRLEGGAVVSAELRTPSERHLRLVEGVALQREVGDALVGVASLDLSPWSVGSGEAG